jgi:hypothetical protein
MKKKQKKKGLNIKKLVASTKVLKKIEESE